MAKGTETADDVSGDRDLDFDLMTLVGARVKALRKRAKIKQMDLAKTIGVKPTYIASVEAGQQNLTLKSLARIATALGISPWMLLLEEDLTFFEERSKLDHLLQILQSATQETDRTAELLRQARALISARSGGPDTA